MRGFAGRILHPSPRRLQLSGKFPDHGGTIHTILKAGGPFTRKARAAQITTIAVKGDRMVRTDKDSSTIIDLTAETVTEVNLEKKTYSVVTFAQMKAAMEKALAEARKKSKEKEQPSNVEASFKVTAKATGKTQTVQSIPAKELLVTMEMEAKDKESGNSGAMNIVNDSWMGTVKGYDEVKAFQTKMAQKLASMVDLSQLQMMTVQPQMVQGMAQVAKEMAKVPGMPLSSVVKMGAGSTEELAKLGSDKEAPKEEKGNAVTGALADRFGLHRKKDEEKPAADDKKSPEAMLMVEMTMELSQFSTAAVEATRFDVPAGFKQVESDMAKRAR
ncbi:MAG: hypothetical protein WDO18_06475 [Acidobacteriota bacterium]